MDKTFGNKQEGYEYRPRQAVYAIIFNDTREEVVTVQTTDGYYWLPGGGIEGDESHHNCLWRELLEETGYDVEIADFIGKAKQFFISSSNEHIANEGNFYLAQLLSKVSEPVEDDHSLKWIPVSSVEEFLYHQHQAWAVKEGLKHCLHVKEG
ncbi:NUDIX domain-containing protein [Neobacillus niacini]|uniref:NUDIX hydrolase n=1 Tax=Neobacillus niacini TaxID=86668 RepID=UPI002FFF36F0